MTDIRNQQDVRNAAIASLRHMESKGLIVTKFWDGDDGWLDGFRVLFIEASIQGELRTFKSSDGRGWMVKSPHGGWLRGEDLLLEAIGVEVEFVADGTDRFRFETMGGYRLYTLKQMALGFEPAKF